MYLTESAEKINELLRDFYRLTNIKICIYDSEEHELYYYPEKLTPFCNELRKNREMEKKCLSCDRNAFIECKKTHLPSIHVCHAGLIECFAPILYNNVIIGYIAIGQIKERQQSKFPFSESKIDGIDCEALGKKFEELPYIEREKLDAAMRILNVCAGYEYLRSLVNEMTYGIERRISDYIESHLSGDLSVEKLERELHISRRMLYEVFRESYSTSVASFIKERRLQKSCELLKETDESISKISEKSGFSDYNYFSKQFKKTFGVSPLSYRKNAKRFAQKEKNKPE